MDFLPDFEQRWPNTCFYFEQHRILLVGDRQGNLLSYDLNQDDSSVLCPIYQQFARLHGINGTSSIDLDESTQSIHSCGRDGYINIFNFDVDQRQLIHQTTLTITSEITWLDRLFPQLSLISCFTTNHFCLYLSDEQSKRRLMEVECGGGHRNNDLFIEKNLQVNFSYVRNKQVFLARKNIMRIVNEATCLSRTPPSHGTEIRCIKLFHFNQRLHLTTGSEDTQIKLFAFEVKQIVIFILQKRKDEELVNKFLLFLEQWRTLSTYIDITITFIGCLRYDNHRPGDIFLWCSCTIICLANQREFDHAFRTFYATSFTKTSWWRRWRKYDRRSKA